METTITMELTIINRLSLCGMLC